MRLDLIFVIGVLAFALAPGSSAAAFSKSNGQGSSNTDWTYISCTASTWGTILYRFNSQRVDRFGRDTESWYSQCTGLWACTVTPEAITLTIDQGPSIQHERFTISRATGRYTVQDVNGGRRHSGSCAQTSDPLDGRRRF